MRLTEFPNIHWLRKQAENNFQDGKGANNQLLNQKGWPTVVLNTTSFGAERNGIKGPFSVFLNLSGNSLVKVGNRTVELTTDNLCVVNSGEYYDLIIPEGSRTDTFNIHFGEQLFTEVQSFVNSTAEALLDDPTRPCNAYHASDIHSTWKDDLTQKKIQRLHRYYQFQDGNDELELELLGDLLTDIIHAPQNHTYKNRHHLSALKRSTRFELLNRIGRSLDHMHAHFRETITLDQLANIACMSKYHYLRTFKSIYNCTPQQKIAALRLDKASFLLKESDQPLSEIAPSLGFSELAAFTRFFTKRTGLSPKAYRQRN